MIRIGTPVSYVEDGKTRVGSVERTSRRTGRELYRIGDRWIDADYIVSPCGLQMERDA